MVFNVLLDWSLRGSLWVIQQTYKGLYRIYYGREETDLEKIINELKLLRQENEEIRKNLNVAK